MKVADVPKLDFKGMYRQYMEQHLEDGTYRHIIRLDEDRWFLWAFSPNGTFLIYFNYQNVKKRRKQIVLLRYIYNGKQVDDFLSYWMTKYSVDPVTRRVNFVL